MWNEYMEWVDEWDNRFYDRISYYSKIQTYSHFSGYIGLKSRGTIGMIHFRLNSTATLPHYL